MHKQSNPHKPEHSGGESFAAFKKMAVLWLFLTFSFVVRQSFVHDRQAPPSDAFRAAERLAVVSKYSSTLPEGVRDEMSKAAVEMEEDPVAKRVFQGQTVTEEELRGLSPTVRMLARQQEKPGPVGESALRDLAAEGLLRLELTVALLLGLGVFALATLFMPKSEAKPGVVSPETLNGWDVFGVFFLWHLGGFLLAGFLLWAWHGVIEGFSSIFLSQMSVYFLMLTLFGFLRHTYKELPFRRFEAAWVGKGFGLALLTVFVTNVLTSMITGESTQSENPILAVFEGAPLIQYIGLGLLVVVIGPFFEELMFRGWIYGGLAKRWGDTPAMVTSAALFAIIHGDAPGLPALFGLGLIFAWVYRRSGSLWASILVHGMWNATTFSLLISVMP